MTSRHPAAQPPTKGTDLELSVLLYVRLPLLGGWLFNDIPRSGFDPIAEQACGNAAERAG
jgi:hypothetical protein